MPRAHPGRPPTGLAHRGLVVGAPLADDDQVRAPDLLVERGRSRAPGRCPGTSRAGREEEEPGAEAPRGAGARTPARRPVRWPRGPPGHTAPAPRRARPRPPAWPPSAGRRPPRPRAGPSAGCPRRRRPGSPRRRGGGRPRRGRWRPRRASAAPPSGRGSPRPSRKRTPSALAMPAPPSLVALPADADDDVPEAGVERGPEQLAGAEGRGDARVAAPLGDERDARGGGHLDDGASGRPPRTPQRASTGRPSGPRTVRVSKRPPVAVTSASTVPSPPSAMGTFTTCASGQAAQDARAPWPRPPGRPRGSP